MNNQNMQQISPQVQNMPLLPPYIKANSPHKTLQTTKPQRLKQRPHPPPTLFNNNRKPHKAYPNNPSKAITRPKTQKKTPTHHIPHTRPPPLIHLHPLPPRPMPQQKTQSFRNRNLPTLRLPASLSPTTSTSTTTATPASPLTMITRGTHFPTGRKWKREWELRWRI